MMRRSGLGGQTIICCFVRLQALVVRFRREVGIIRLVVSEDLVCSVWAIFTCSEQTIATHACRCLRAALITLESCRGILP